MSQASNDRHPRGVRGLSVTLMAAAMVPVLATTAYAGVADVEPSAVQGGVLVQQEGASAPATSNVVETSPVVADVVPGAVVSDSGVVDTPGTGDTGSGDAGTGDTGTGDVGPGGTGSGGTGSGDTGTGDVTSPSDSTPQGESPQDPVTDIENPAVPASPDVPEQTESQLEPPAAPDSSTPSTLETPSAKSASVASTNSGEAQGVDANDNAKTGAALSVADAKGAQEQPDGKVLEVAASKGSPSISYTGHVQDIGWQKAVSDGDLAGTSGMSKRLEALQIRLDLAETGLDGHVQYKVHVENIGWQPTVSDGAVAGTTGRSLRVEGLRIWLGGTVASAYDIYYRSHIQDYGWLDWAYNGDFSGSTGLAKRLEAIEIRLVVRGGQAPGSTLRPSVPCLLSADQHIQNIGWQVASTHGSSLTLGKAGSKLRLEAFDVSLNDTGVSGSLRYNAHVSDIGWQKDASKSDTWASNGATAGTTGLSKRIEAIQFQLTGEARSFYDVYYRAYVTDYGWLDWARNGQAAGTQGHALKLESVELKLVPRGSAAPGETLAPFDSADTYSTMSLTGFGSNARSSVMQAKNDATRYAYLPSHANLSAVGIETIQDGKPGQVYVSGQYEGNYVRVSSGKTFNLAASGARRLDNGAYVVYIKRDTTLTPQALVVMKSDAVGSVFLKSSDPVRQGRSYIESSRDHSAKTTGSMSLFTATGGVTYDGALTQIKGRGNTTWEADKKGYQIKLATSTDLMGTGRSSNKSKTWVLLANRYDPTLISNRIANDLGLELGLSGIESRPVDLFYDGEYRGSYLLSEKVQIDKSRVNIEDPDKQIEKANPNTDLSTLSLGRGVNSYGMRFQYVIDAKDPETPTDSFLVELDNNYYKDEPCWFATSNGKFVVKSPEYASYDCIRRISEQVQEAIDNLKQGTAAAGTGDATGTGSGYTFDIESFSKVALVNRLEKNCDWLRSSSFFYKDAGSQVIMAGPLWDFDRGLGNLKENGQRLSPTGLYAKSYNDARWVESIDSLNQGIKEQWQNFYHIVNDVLLGDGSTKGTYVKSLAEYQREVSASERMNKSIWDTNYGECGGSYSTYESLMSAVTSWLRTRLDWLASLIG